MKEQVSARVVRSDAPTVLEEEQDGKTFSRRVRYTLSPVYNGTMLNVEDESISRASASSPARSLGAT
jgi:hypothetical protein